jgi:hypothetical protein
MFFRRPTLRAPQILPIGERERLEGSIRVVRSANRQTSKDLTNLLNTVDRVRTTA